MKDGAAALESALARIKTSLSQGRYEIASQASTDLIRLSYDLESKSGVFTGEVLEAIFMQVDYVLNTHIIPEGDQKELNGVMTKHLDNIIEGYNTQNSPCDLLTNMRYDATVFQFESDFKYKSSKGRRRAL